jgi:NADH-quinone oxidoreductase subunit M
MSLIDVLADEIVYIGVSRVFELSMYLSLPLYILSTFTLIVVLLTSWYMTSNILLISSLIFIIEFCLFGAFSVTSIFLFLCFFEISALALFIFIVYSGSARRERIKAGYYFLFFTLYGSISLLFLLITLYHDISNWFYVSEGLSIVDRSSIMLVLILLALIVKIPIVPFALWLPQAHVEASTGASILLASCMLKLGCYGLIKFVLPILTLQKLLYFRSFLVTLCSFSLIYASIAMIRQIDLKRQIAFSSIAHMSFCTLGLLISSNIGLKGAVLLMISHGLTSTFMFYCVGILSDRFHSRSIMAYSSLFSTMPVFSGFFLFGSLANISFPGTSGFLPEVMILTSILSSTGYSVLILAIGIFLTTVGTFITTLRILFGSVKIKGFRANYLDIDKLEISILSILSLLILCLGTFSIFM